MHKIIKNLTDIESNIKLNLDKLGISEAPKIIAVSKTFKVDKILPLINYGHVDFGENKVQEANDKWSDIKEKNKNLKLHMIGKLQTNKVKYAVKIFDYIHSVDSEKLAQKISEEQLKIGKNIKIFIQVNVGSEDQKSGINKESVKSLISFCLKKNLNLIGLMCIPPIDVDPSIFFSEMQKFKDHFNLKELSMGMSSDYLTAIKYSATYLRIGSNIFGQRY